MHIVLAVLAGIAGVLIWSARISRGASELSDATQGLRNLPRKRAFQRHARASGFDLVQSPLEAATVLLVAVAMEGRSRALTEAERQAIRAVLVERLEQSPRDADDLLVQCEALLHDVNQPDGAVRAMTQRLAPVLCRREAYDLADGLAEVADAGGAATDAQTRFLYGYRERMNLLD